MTPYNTPPEPYQCSEYCGHNSVNPQWPDKAPEQEAYLDMHPVLDGEDNQHRKSDERDEHPAAESLTRLFRLLFFTLLTHTIPPTV
jgi:hypothetical protein